MADTKGPIVAASDYVKMLPDSIAKYAPRPIVSLGTDGFGRSEARAELRDHFEVDAKHIAWAALKALGDDGQLTTEELSKAMRQLGIDPDKIDPYVA